VTRRADLPQPTGFAYLDAVVDPPGSVIAMAHRGGAAHPDLINAENTMEAFDHAVSLGYQYLETDTHVSADGILYAFHDDTLDRVTDTTGQISSLDSRVLNKIRVAGQYRIPTLPELLSSFPQTRFNIDLKSDGAVEPLVKLLASTHATDRVCVGSFSHQRLIKFRKLTKGEVATSASPVEVGVFLALSKTKLYRLPKKRPYQALQIPLRQGPIPIATAALISQAHQIGVHVHVWTVDDRSKIEHLLALGVDGFITDRTDVLKNVLIEKGLWKGTP